MVNLLSYKDNIMDTSLKEKVLKLSDEEGLCPICAPNKGCNCWNKPRDLRNWKKYRKTQYKNGKE